MPFSYYYDLSVSGKRIYRKSDAIDSVPVEVLEDIYPAVFRLKKSLEVAERRDVAGNASEICRLVCEELGVEPLSVKISSKRPSDSTRELHGLYEWTEGEPAVLTVWMNTAVKGKTVAFRSFIRTVLHELCHHLDYAYFKLEDSFHTDGFFKRESHLYRQIVPPELQKKDPRKKRTLLKKHSRNKNTEKDQMELF